MKKSIILILISLFLIPVLTNAGESRRGKGSHYHQHESRSLWKGYKGEGYYDYWYNPDRKRARREANKWPSGQHLKEPMGNYPTKGYFGGYRINFDGTKEQWSYTTEE